MLVVGGVMPSGSGYCQHVSAARCWDSCGWGGFGAAEVAHHPTLGRRGGVSPVAGTALRLAVGHTSSLCGSICRASQPTRSCRRWERRIPAVDLLSQDTKTFALPSGALWTFSTVQQPLTELARSSPSWATAFARLLEDSCGRVEVRPHSRRRSCFGLVMCVATHPDGSLRRDLAVLAPHDADCTAIEEAFCAVSGATFIAQGTARCQRGWIVRLLALNNAEASRKKLQPVINESAALAGAQRWLD